MAVKKGTDHHSCKINEDIVKQIRNSRHLSLKTIANKYGISISNVHLILSNKTWRHI
jgi:transcriptional regulator with XRE-family HTH domain